MPVEILSRSFYQRTPLEVARDLLGARLVRRMDGQRLAGLISETEAYWGESDLACHARAGLTPRTRVMYGPPGVAYVYFNYGVHWMLNVVTETEGQPSAVLIRGIFPVEGLERMMALRPRPLRPSPRGQSSGGTSPGWTDGPAKVCQALGITGAFNGLDLCDPQAELCIEEGTPVSEAAVHCGPRVGINSVPEPWKSKPWRFWMSLP
jgi:DNA-3-methyladenine glycosylase